MIVKVSIVKEDREWESTFECDSIDGFVEMEEFLNGVVELSGADYVREVREGDRVLYSCEE